eukprot:GHVS01054513.1.p1 GENE.GHVS01054513.1~~GHVS01054513.1.p1  ORF type:complete len:202 (-),score=32.85 GHVS01054513.1:52-570(-)
MAAAPLGSLSAPVGDINTFAIPGNLRAFLQLSMFLLAVVHRYKSINNNSIAQSLALPVGSSTAALIDAGADELTTALSDDHRSAADTGWDASAVLQLNFLLLSASLYISPLTTDWAPPMAADGTPNVSYPLPAAVAALLSPYVYMTTFGLLSALTYAWSLAAPLLLPHRQFD